MMPKHRKRSVPQLTLLSLLTYSQIASATLSLQDLQPIANFPAKCQAAYQTLIPQCPDAKSFASTSSSSGPSLCTTECLNALNTASHNIQVACAGSLAPPNTVIAYAFTGDLALWLCTLGTGSSSQTSSNPKSSTTSSPTAVTTPNSVSTAKSSDSISSSGSSLSGASIGISARTSTTDAISGSDSATKTPPLSTTTSPSSSSTSISSSVSSNQSSSTSTTTTTSSRSEPTLAPGGGGSPFDQVVPNASPPHLISHSILSLLMLVMGTILILTLQPTN